MKVEVAVDIAAPPPIVHGVVFDVAHSPEFITGIRSVEMLDPGPLRVGTTLPTSRPKPSGVHASPEMPGYSAASGRAARASSR